MRIVTLPGVYTPRGDTAMLAGTVLDQPLAPGSSVLELCSGSGAVGLTLAARGYRVTAVDVSRRATLTCRLNARLNRLSIRAVTGDLLDAIGDARFDMIVSNPPYVPTPPGERTAGASRAWNAGPDGRSVLDRICREAPRHLEPGGQILIIQSSLAGTDLTVEALEHAGLQVEVIARRLDSLGPISSGREAFLRAEAYLEGEHEELAVIRGRRVDQPALKGRHTVDRGGEGSHETPVSAR